MNKLWYEAASSIGIAVTGEQNYFVLPEDAIFLLAQDFDFKKDRKAFGLMKLWLSEYAQYLRVDLLKSRVKNLSLADKDLSVVGALVSFCYDVDGIRWRSLFENIKNSCKSFKLKLAPDEVLHSRGRDINFIDFGVETSQIKIAEQKKLMSSKFVFTHNKWMQYRKLLGPIIRADFLTAFKYSLINNPFQAKQILGCSQASSYKNWNELEASYSYDLISKENISQDSIILFNNLAQYFCFNSTSKLSKAS